MRTSKYGEYNAYVLDDPTLRAGNPVKEILLKLNPPDHRYNILYCKKVLTKLEVKSKGITTSSQKESRFTTSCSIDKDKYMMKAQVHVSKSSAISDVQELPQKEHYQQDYWGLTKIYLTSGSSTTLSIMWYKNHVKEMLREIISKLSRP
ncbi:hypothetical protein Tco_0645024 [Tanacetum coccineum]